MDIQAHIKYTEGYLPTPRHRKLRYRECDEIITATLREVEKNDLKLAFEDNSYEGKGKIYSCDGELWVKSETNQPHCIRTSLEELQEDFMKYSWFYGFDPEDTREKQIAKVVEKLSDYIVADGELYAKSGEPRYCIYTFGLGHNHGGTSLSVDYMYNSNISKDRYFSALDGEKALQTAIEIATNRGDTESIEHFSADIVVHDPKAVTIKPEIQHGDGDEFLGKLESVISGSSDIAESGLLAMLLTGAEMNKAEPEKHIIWSNINLDLDDWKDDLKEEYPDKSDDELYIIPTRLSQK